MDKKNYLEQQEFDMPSTAVAIVVAIGFLLLAALATELQWVFIAPVFIVMFFLCLSASGKFSAAINELHLALSTNDKNSSLLASEFKAYEAQLIERDGQIYSMAPAAEYFGADRLTREYLNTKLYDSFPNSLIGLGVMFTFLGLALAMHVALHDLGTGSAEVMQKALQQLLTLAGIKFTTSVAGILLSLYFLKSYKGHLFKLEIALNAHCAKLDEQYPVYPFEQKLIEGLNPELSARNARLINEAAVTLRDSASNLAGVAQGMQSLNADAIGEKLGQVISPVLVRMSEEMGESQLTMHRMFADMRGQVLEPMAAKLDEANRLNQNLAGTIGTLSDGLLTVSKQVADTTQVIQTFQQDTVAELNRFAAQLQGTLETFQQETNGSMQEVAKQIDKALHVSLEGIKAQRDSFELSSQAILKELSQTGDETRALLKAAGEEVRSTLSGVHASLIETKGVVQDELTNFRVAYQDSLTSFFNEQNNLLEQTLGEQRDGLANVVREMQKVLRAEHDQRMETTASFQATLSQLEQTANALGLNAIERYTALQELAGQYCDMVDRLDNSYQRLSQQLEQTQAGSAEQLKSYMEAMELRGKSLSDSLDSSIASISTHLLGAAELLVAGKAEAETVR